MSSKSVDKLLFTAIRNGNISDIRSCIEKGANLNSTNSKKETPIMYAFEIGNLEVINALIELGATLNPDDALIDVCCAGHIHLIDYLLDKGSNINTNRYNGRTPLLFAYENMHYNIVDFLLSKDIGMNMNLHDDNEETPLLYSIRGNVSINRIRRIIELGADVNFSVENNMTAICVASQFNNPEVVQLLLDNGSHINRIPSCDYVPVVNASRCGQFQNVKLLLERGADPNCEDADGNTALLGALEYNHLDIARLLLVHGATMNINTNISDEILNKWKLLMTMYCLEKSNPNDFFDISDFDNY